MNAATERRGSPAFWNANGHSFELDFFGVKSCDLHHIFMPGVKDLKIKSLRPYCTPKFQERMYGFTPDNPQTELGKFVFEKIKESLSEKDKGKLHMYCLLGSPADRMGADCSIQLRGKNKQALVDLTTNPKKQPADDDILILHYNALMLAYHKQDPQYFERFIQRVVDKLHPRIYG